MLKVYPNAPAHLLLDHTPYFITGTIYDKRPLLASAELKTQLLEKIRQGFARYRWRLDDWVILDNHYHILGKSDQGKDLGRIMQFIHSQSAGFIRQATEAAPPIWWNYWDYCPRDESDYRVRQNYLLYNPVKHGYVQDLKEYPWSSFHERMEAEGREQLAITFRSYSGYRELVIDEDDF